MKKTDVYTESLPLDAHLHLWNPSAFTLGWLEGLDALNREFTPELYAADIGGAAGAVYVEVDVARDERDREIDVIGRLVDSPSNPVCAMVAALNPAREDIADYLHELTPRASHIVGFRQVLHTPEMPAGYCRSPEFIAGAKIIGGWGFSFDLCMRSAELSDAAALVSRCPKTQFVLDHCGVPAISEYHDDDGAYARWKKDISSLAALPNLVCKVSGLVTQAGNLEESGALMKEMLEYLKEEFGARRMMFGSDWPVCTLAESAAAWKARLGKIGGGVAARGKGSAVGGNRQAGIPRSSWTEAKGGEHSCYGGIGIP